ncbi:hypothetical protein GCM10009665_60390 [Kitasatospora nipponensis]|uniref:Excreted virulence factor EspC (Type VII ESX diderm) n=1 Tax=Kitasatospora nipponensis TaxID=258049 RepID=A0ABN1WS41_9ACTN
MNDINVRPEGLRTTSASVRTTSGQLAPKAGHWLDASFAAQAPYTGWESAGALNDAANAWQTHIASVVQQLQTYADQIDQSANAYDAVNQEATRRFNQALSDLNAGS